LNEHKQVGVDHLVPISLTVFFSFLSFLLI
jgi:hypothetical protein